MCMRHRVTPQEFLEGLDTHCGTWYSSVMVKDMTYLVSTDPINFGTRVYFADTLAQVKELVSSLLFDADLVHVRDHNGKNLTFSKGANHYERTSRSHRSRSINHWH